MKFVLHRTKTVSSTMGHTIEFVKGVPTHVPKEMWPAVTAVGAVPEDELPEDAIAKKDEVLDPQDRKAMIFAAFEQIVTKGDRDAFTGNGSPHAKIVSEIVNFTVDAKERDAAWSDFRQANKAD